MHVGFLPNRGLPTYSWPLYSFPLAGELIPPPVVYTDGQRANYQIEIVSPNRTDRWPVLSYEAMSASMGKHGEGELNITFDPSSVDLDLYPLLQSDGYGWSVDFVNMEARGKAYEPLFSGPVLNTDIVYGQRTMVSFSCESFQHHILRRRQAMTVNNAIVDHLGDPAGVIAATHLMASYSPSVSFMPAYPLAGRDGLLWWSVNVGAFANGNTLYLQEESATNLWDFIYNVLERGGLGLTFNEFAAAQFTYGGEATYMRSDLSAAAIFTDGAMDRPGSGSLLQARKRVDYSALTNVWLAKGVGAGAAQTSIHIADAPSNERYGAFEDSGTVAGSVSTVALANDAAAHMARMAEPIVTWEVDLILDDEWAFGLDLNRRDKIAFWHSGMAATSVGSGEISDERFLPVEAVIIGWAVNMERGRPKWTLTLGEPPRSFAGEILRHVGQPGGRFSGWREHSRNGW